MNAARVHAVLLAGITDPRLIADWRAAPDLLASLEVALAATELAALEKFAGLALKVRHNNLRAAFPLSFRLMGVAGIEIDLFSAYAAERASESRCLMCAPTVPERARDLIAFVGTWHNERQPSHRLLWDALRFEYALAVLGSWHAAVASAPVTYTLVRGEVVLLELQSDPREYAASLYGDASQLESYAFAERRFCGWREPASGSVTILELDALSHFLLLSLQAGETPDDVARALGSRRAQAAVRRVIAEFARIGILANVGGQWSP